MRSVHVVIAIVGSLGDLLPLLAVGSELRARGHRVTVATHAFHRSAVERAGLDFADGSGIPEPRDRQAFIARAFHPCRGPRFVVRDLAAADVRASYDKLAPVCAHADALITSTLAFAGQILGEQLSAVGQLTWQSAVLAPAGFLSAYDPPATGWAALDAWVRSSPRHGRWLQRMARRITHAWTAPVRRFRRELGLPAVSPLGDPFHAGQHSPQGVLALFSPLLGRPQPDWPRHVHVCGFAHRAPLYEDDPALAAFLDAGPPPLVFTLGSAAVHAGLGFLRESLAAASTLGMRAVLLTGSPDMRSRLPGDLPAAVHAVDYVPHAMLFPRAAVIVHHGGIGTSSEALRAGRPMLVVPHGFDQPDNAARLKRLGVAEVLPASRYRAAAAARLVRALVVKPDYRQRAAACAATMLHERSAAMAASLVEMCLPGVRPGRG